jgi:2,3-bisphosphoglycerate-dependent phosphoglycerate mutase
MALTSISCAILVNRLKKKFHKNNGKERLKKMNRLVIVRHGENLANITKEFSCKRVDYPLTDRGILQAQQTTAFLSGFPVDEIYSSPLKRARETAEIIAAAVHRPVIESEDLREVNVGDLENASTPENWQIHDHIVQEWFAGNSELSFPGGENYYALLRRIRSDIQKIIAGKQNRMIVLVSHGGMFTFTLKDLCPGIDLAALLQTPMRNCSLTTLNIYSLGTDFTADLVRWADIGHLSGEAADFLPTRLAMQTQILEEKG